MSLFLRWRGESGEVCDDEGVGVTAMWEENEACVEGVGGRRRGVLMLQMEWKGTCDWTWEGERV